MKENIGIVLCFAGAAAAIVLAIISFGLKTDNPDMTQMRMLLEFPSLWKWGVGVVALVSVGYGLVKSK